MKIAIVTRGISSTKGGAERFTSSFARKMLDNKHELFICSGEKNNQSFNSSNFYEIKPLRFFSWLKILSFHWKTRKLLKDIKCDVVYGLCQFFPLKVFYAGGGVHKHWMRIRYSNWFYRLLKYLLSPTHLAMVYLENHIFKNNMDCNYVITNSKLVKQHIVRYYSFPVDNIIVIYDGIDHVIFNKKVINHRKNMRIKYGVSENDLLILHVSNNWDRKGVETILKAMAGLPDKFKLMLVGRGKIKKYKKIAKKSGVDSNRIIFAGIASQVECFYGMSDMFVLPTMYDPFAQVCREALACSLPVITTLENGAAEVIVNGENGFILDRWDDYLSLKEYLLKFEDSAVLENMKLKAIESVSTFSWERNFDEHFELFQSILNK